MRMANFSELEWILKSHEYALRLWKEPNLIYYTTKKEIDMYI